MSASSQPTGVLPEEAVLARVAAARAAGQRVVFTNGAFDLLHVGHLRVLEAAAALGDLLVVAVNDDASVRRLRGRGRPVVAAAERARLIAGLRCVDLVLLFAEDSVDGLLERLRPDTHAKGSDYDERSLPERATNQRLGIAMAFVGGPKDHSATDLLARACAASASAAAASGLDRHSALVAPGLRGLVLDRARPQLEAHGWLDLRRLADAGAGEVAPRAHRWVRQVEVGSVAVHVKVTQPMERRRDPRVELGHHTALRAAGFRAPEPWLAAIGDVAGRPTGVLVTRTVGGLALDAWLRTEGPRLGARERREVATGIGLAVRALHAARFLFPDLMAWHLLVEGSPAGGPRSLAFLDLLRLRRAARAIGPAAAAPGLAALLLSLRPVTTPRFRLAIVRAYLGGTLRDSRPWLDAIARRIEHIRGRGTFRHLEEGT